MEGSIMKIVVSALFLFRFLFNPFVPGLSHWDKCLFWQCGQDGSLVNPSAKNMLEIISGLSLKTRLRIVLLTLQAVCDLFGEISWQSQNVGVRAAGTWPLVNDCGRR